MQYTAVQQRWHCTRSEPLRHQPLSSTRTAPTSGNHGNVRVDCPNCKPEHLLPEVPTPESERICCTRRSAGIPRLSQLDINWCSFKTYAQTPYVLL